MIARSRARLPRGEAAWALGLLVVAAAVVWEQGRLAGLQSPSNLIGVDRDIVKTGAAAAGLFGICGYGPARLLLPAEWRPHLLLFMLPVGAACSTLALTLLGLAHVPLSVSLVVVLSLGGALTLFSCTRGPRSLSLGAHPITAVAVPLALAALVAAVSLMPSLRAGFATVQGQNGDAILAVGTADFLAHAPPTAVRPELALDRVPLLWRSKLPIYYGLASVTRLAHQDEIKAFPSLAGFVLGMFALGVFLFAFHALRAPPLVALLAAFLVPLARIVVYVSMHTYYNQLWALFALPFVLLFGWRFLREPDGRGAILLGLFLALALFTYPLLLPFPLLFLAVIAWPERRRARTWLRALRLPRWAYVLAAAAAVPVVAVLLRGVYEKVVPAFTALLPWGSLNGWGGNDVLPYLPFGRFFGVEAGPVALEALLVAAVFGAAVVGLLRSRREVAIALAILLAGALLAGVYVRVRTQGELFWFKDLAFAGPLVVLLAVVGLGSLRRTRALQAAGAIGLALLSFALFDGARREIHGTYELGSANVLMLRDWDSKIPADQTIRIDIPPNAWQLWGWYLMPRHRVSAVHPMKGFFPHPPFGLAADLSLVRGPGHAPDAIGPPLYQNPDFSIWRLKRGTFPDTSSRALIFDVNSISVGF